MSDFPNVLVHEYDRVDPKIIWNVAIGELPNLQQKIKKIVTK